MSELASPGGLENPTAKLPCWAAAPGHLEGWKMTLREVSFLPGAVLSPHIAPAKSHGQRSSLGRGLRSPGGSSQGCCLLPALCSSPGRGCSSPGGGRLSLEQSPVHTHTCTSACLYRVYTAGFECFAETLGGQVLVIFLRVRRLKQLSKLGEGR